MARTRIGRELSSVGTHFALTTTAVLIAVLTVVFVELTAREQTRSLAARQSAAEIVTVLFANSSSAALTFDDSDALRRELTHVAATPGVVGAALFRDNEAAPAAATPAIGACAELRSGAVDIDVEREQLAVAQPIYDNEGRVGGRACVVFSLSEENKSFRVTRWRMAIRGTLTAAAIAVLLIVVSRRKVVRPLLRLIEAATSIERGDNRRAAQLERSDDEIGHLARAFDRMGQAVADREQRLRAELDTAAHLQLSVLPRTTVVPGLEIAAVMETATEVGGDYYDVIPVESGCWLGIGDVSGHGLGSGVVMLMIQSAVGALVREAGDAAPAQVEAVVNRMIYENVRLRMGRRDHATLTLLKYEESGRVRFVGAHEDILVFRAGSKKVEQVETPGTWVGVVPSIEAATTESSLDLGLGDVMVLYTDGLTEAFRAGEQFGMERLIAVVEQNGTRAVDEIRDAIMAAVKDWSRGVVRDDMSLVVVRHVGRRTASAAVPKHVADEKRERIA
jgi:serine phosphatase RsbU (regulator of sigma subunit)